ncbi:MAG: hypothetical protein J7M19_00610 [Planctomycetes bacterium]|nr:hypothetical protein [Planctomycetota bacterium]
MAKNGTALREIAAILARGYLRLAGKARHETAETTSENSRNSSGIALMGAAENGFMCVREVETE